jgi:hypothetical protein
MKTDNEQLIAYWSAAAFRMEDLWYTRADEVELDNDIASRAEIVAAWNDMTVGQKNRVLAIDEHFKRDLWGALRLVECCEWYLTVGARRPAESWWWHVPEKAESR